MELVEKKDMGAAGRIGIPEDLRAALGMQTGTPVAIYRDRNRVVLVVAHDMDPEMGCSLCGKNIAEVRVSTSSSICRTCAIACASALKQIEADIPNINLR